MCVCVQSTADTSLPISVDTPLLYQSISLSASFYLSINFRRAPSLLSLSLSQMSLYVPHSITASQASVGKFLFELSDTLELWLLSFLQWVNTWNNSFLFFYIVFLNRQKEQCVHSLPQHCSVYPLLKRLGWQKIFIFIFTYRALSSIFCFD